MAISAISVARGRPGPGRITKALTPYQACLAVWRTDLGTIVVVEDDTNIADLVDMYLRREGFRVIQAGHGGGRPGGDRT